MRLEKPDLQLEARIKVIGVGGAGCNAVNRMIEAGLQGVDFITCNTDEQALVRSLAETKLILGKTVTRGLGAGGDPELGMRAAEEDRQEIKNLLEESDMVFITAGLGGGTGTGAAPVIAELAKDLGALTIAVVTKPFAFERGRRMAVAEQGLERLRDNVDTLVGIPNERLLGVVDDRATLLDAFRMADEVLRQGVQGISDLILVPGLINLDYADVKTIMKDAGTALMGIGTGSGDNRAVDAARAAISSPLLETTVEGASRILFNITGSENLTLAEVEEAAQAISSAADSRDANVIFGAVLDEKMGDEVRITVLATGFDRMPRVTVAKAEKGHTSDNDLEIPAFLRKR